jgi:lipopolysaccharide transport system ATP-binding protein
MSVAAISVEGLGKRYHIGTTSAPYGRLTESLWRALNTPMAIARRTRKDAGELIWALRGVSFDVREGGIIGVIGRNGAGKSTLLKILSRITEPTEGRVVMRGRVGCLLEVGTGFHPELTGRENVYMSGAILGMRREEISRKFDEIVDFSGVERFLDTPVKHYSSGMQVRLGFAVAAHMETEILIIDEVLAVGDAAFQEKCLGKMGDVSSQGRTIVFVSHNLEAIAKLCPEVLVIDAGACTYRGEANEAIAYYLASTADAS